MQKYSLREAAKFGAGLVTGDFLVCVWLLSRNAFPFFFLGISWTPQLVSLWLIVDVVFIVSLVFYGWYKK